jgi:hypothetical protein
MTKALPLNLHPEYQSLRLGKPWVDKYFKEDSMPAREAGSENICATTQKQL